MPESGDVLVLDEPVLDEPVLDESVLLLGLFV
jgi:hypothetical protein